MDARLSDAIVVISSRKPQETGFGTGFVIHCEGQTTYLLTCAHVVEDVGGVDAVKAGGMDASVVALGNSSDIDLAVLRVDGLPNPRSLKLGATGQEGSPFTTAGFRLLDSKQGSKQYRVLQGRLGKETGIAGKAANFAQTWDLEITEAGAPDKLEPGCSGSPVIDKNGYVLGVATHRLEAGKRGQAISIRELERIWTDMPTALRESLQGVPILPPEQPWLERMRRLLLGDRTLHSALRTSGIIAFLVIGVRFMGWLQPVELWAFDQLMRSRPDSPEADKRLLIIEVDQDPNTQNTGVSLSDKTLLELLTTLDAYQPKVIGLDIYRKSVVASTYQQTLGERLKTDKRLITVCKVPAPKDGDPGGMIAPPEIPKEQLNQRVGFSDFVSDPGKIVRRQLLEMSLDGRQPPCLTPYAFSFQLAASYLVAEPVISSTTYTLKGIAFPPIEATTGGYQGVDAFGHQILLNYRSVQGSPRNVAETVTLQNFLKRDVPFQTLKDRIVLIGVTAPDKGDDWLTPYQEEIPGVFIQAQMTSQLLSAVAGERPLLWVWIQPGEWLWMLGWSMIGGILVWRFRRVKSLSFAIAGALSILWLVCFGTLAIWGGWLPLVSPFLALGVSAIAVRIITYTGEES